jgi:hypothetical protein
MRTDMINPYQDYLYRIREGYLMGNIDAGRTLVETLTRLDRIVEKREEHSWEDIEDLT